MTDWIETADAAWLAPTDRAASGAVVLLPDAGETAVGTDWSDELSARGLAAVLPRHPDPWWTDRRSPGEPPDAETAEARVLRVAAVAAERHGGVAIAGVGAGGHGALRIAYKHPRWFPVAAAWRPALDCHNALDRWRRPATGLGAESVRALSERYGGDPERARQDSATLHIHPLNWPRHQRFDCPPSDAWWEGCDRLRMKLTSLGVPHEADLETASDEGAPAARLVAWLADRLEDERRRVP